MRSLTMATEKENETYLRAIAVAAVCDCSKRDASSDQAAVRDRITSVERALSTLTRRVESQVAHVADTVNDQRDWVKQVR